MHACACVCVRERERKKERAGEKGKVKMSDCLSGAFSRCGRCVCVCGVRVWGMFDEVLSGC